MQVVRPRENYAALTESLRHVGGREPLRSVVKADKLSQPVASSKRARRSARYSPRSNEPALAPEFRSPGESATLHAGRRRTGLRPFLFSGRAAHTGVARGGLRVRGGAGGGAGGVPHARADGGGRGGRWHGVRVVPDRLDRGGGRLRVRHFGGVGTVRDHQAVGRRDLLGPASASAAGRLRIRRAAGRRGWRRSASGGDGGDDDRAGIPAVPDGGNVPDRQLGAGGLGRNGQPGAHAGG